MVITYSSMKGGVGKTTNAILTATNLAARGFKVLFFDLDTNNSGTMYFTQGIEGITDTIESHNVFESLSHNDIERPTNKLSPEEDSERTKERRSIQRWMIQISTRTMKIIQNSTTRMPFFDE